MRSIVSRLKSWLFPAEQKASGYASPQAWFVDLIRGGGSTDSGVVISGETILTYAPIWNAVNRIAGHVAQLPLKLFRAGEETKTQETGHPSFMVVRRPNEMQTSMQFRELLQCHALLWGNGRARVERQSGRPVGLVPLLPWMTETGVVNGEKWHVVTHADGSKTSVPDVDCVHVTGLGTDGVVGLSLIDIARNSLGLGLAAEKASNRHFANNGIPGMVLQAPPGVFHDEEQAKTFLDAFNKAHAGLSNTNRVGLLREGITANPLAIPAHDAQWIEQRKFQRQDAALWMLLEQILGDDSSVSYSSLEQKHMAYLQNCLMRWLVKWEQELDSKLLTEEERADGYYFRFNTNGLLRGTAIERFQVYQIAISNRILSPNEVRALEELDPYEGGDSYENPAITPGSTGSGGKEKSDEPKEESTEAKREIVRKRFATLLAAEGKHAIEAAEHKSNFCGWIASFYSSGWFDTIERHVARSGGEPDLATGWLDFSKERLLNVAGIAKTQAELVQMVRDECSTWGVRAEDMAAEIFGG